MSDRPPREGARWGEDPKLPDPTPPPPDRYEVLANEFGEANVQKALELRTNILIEYPHIDLRNLEPLDFASALLETASRNIKEAIKDGRPHTMPETLELIGTRLGRHAATDDVFNASLFVKNGVTVRFGDEAHGYAGQEQARLAAEAEKKRKAKEDEKKGLIVLFCTIVAASAGGSAAGVGGAIAAAVLAFFIVGAVVYGQS